MMFISQILCVCIHAKSLQSCLNLCDPTGCRHQTPLSMGFPGQEYWSGLPFSSPGDLPNPLIEPAALMSPASIFHVQPQAYEFIT